MVTELRLLFISFTMAAEITKVLADAKEAAATTASDARVAYLTERFMAEARKAAEGLCEAIRIVPVELGARGYIVGNTTKTHVLELLNVYEEITVKSECKTKGIVENWCRCVPNDDLNRAIVKLIGLGFKVETQSKTFKETLKHIPSVRCKEVFHWTVVEVVVSWKQ